MSCNLLEFIPKLKFLCKTLIVQTQEGDFTIDITQNDWYRVEKRFFANAEQVVNYIPKSIVRVIELDHDTDEEIFLYTKK